MMCGNASRCIGKYVYEKGLTDKEVITLETFGNQNPETSYRQRGGEGCNRRYGYAPAIKPRTDSYENRRNAGRNYLGRWKRNTKEQFVCMGNPHVVIFVDDIKRWICRRLARNWKIIRFS